MHVISNSPILQFSYLPAGPNSPNLSPLGVRRRRHATLVTDKNLTMTKEKANLARIRDNQRRSRARRKEYLQELEARLRQCELQGIEASAEIQQVARRVADENKKLRHMLAQRGVADDSIDSYLQSSQSNEPLMSNQFGSDSVAVQVLEQLLQTRKAICSDGNTGAPTNARSAESSASGNTVQSMWNLANGHKGFAGHQLSGKAASSAHQYMTPSRTGSSIGSMSQRSSHAMSQHQRPDLALPQGSPHMSNLTHHYDYDSQFSHSNHSSYSPPRSSQQPLQYTPITPASSSNVNSCVYATDMITAMAGTSDPSAVRSELGCHPDMDCEVDNQLIFDVMDRYSSSGVGI